MEILSPFEGLDEGEWISPRISFSQDFQFSGRCSPKMQLTDSPEEGFSFMFPESASLDLSSNDSMLTADELFFNGKVRPLQRDASSRVVGGYFDVQNVGFERSIGEKPRCHSMSSESGRGEVQCGRAYMSLNSSRCSSPSRTMSRTSPTSPEHSSISDRELSALSGKMNSATALTLLEDFPSSSTSDRHSSSTILLPSSKHSSKLKGFFKLKKGNMTKNVPMPSFPTVSTSAEISRESVQASGSASCRLPSKSFWPFSRSNSAGESKTSPAISLPPRRSNSAGEGKTTSSSLLPLNGSSADQVTQRKSTLVPNMTVQLVNGVASPVEATSGLSVISKKGLPPLPNSNSKKSNGFLAAARCGTDAVTVVSQSALLQASSSSNRSKGIASTLSNNEADPLVCQSISQACANESFVCIDEGNPGGDIKPDARLIVPRGRRNSVASPGRPVRRAAHNSVARNFARASPGRRGAWNSPGRGHGGRVSIRSLNRGSLSSKGYMRPPDMLGRDGASGRISPVLNVAVPSLRGPKASPKSKIFRLGHLFSKRERVASSQAINVLPPSNQM